MSADGRLESAAQRAVAFGTSGESYTNVWKAMQELHIVELEASQENPGNRIDKLVEQDMLFFILGTVVSADSLVDAESCEKALKIVRELKEDLPLSKLRDDKKLKARLDEAEQIIMHDMEAFANGRRSHCSGPRFFVSAKLPNENRPNGGTNFGQITKRFLVK